MRRNSLMIGMDALRAIRETTPNITNLLQKTNIPYTRGKALVDLFLRNGLVVFRDDKLHLTEVGLQGLKEYDRSVEIAKSFGLEA